MTASFGILVKQWFHEFLAQNTQDPKFRIRIRFFRSEGLDKWQVFQIAAGLPLLLQVALLLFFIGLAEFLVLLHPIVGWVSAGTIMAWAGIFLFTILAPLWSSQCPYKTPVLKTLLISCRTRVPIMIMRSLGFLCSVHHPLQYIAIAGGAMSRLVVWLKEQHEKLNSFKTIEEDKVGEASDSDVAIVLASETLFLDAQIKKTIGECVEDSNIRGILTNYKDALNPPSHKSSRGSLWKFQPKSLAKDRIDETFIAILLHKHRHPRAGEEPFSEILASIVCDGETGIWWELFIRIAVGFIRSELSDGALLVFLVIYQPIYRRTLDESSLTSLSDIPHGDLQCEPFTLYLTTNSQPTDDFQMWIGCLD